MKDFFKYLLATILGLVITGIIFTFIGAGIIAGLIGSTDKKIKIEPKSVLEINLSGTILERKQDNPLDELPLPGNKYRIPQSGLNQILTEIDKAALDKNIIGIYLKTNVLDCGYATIDEIRAALKRFKSTGKFVVAYADMYTQKGYYLSTVANELYANPAGMIELKGISSETTYFTKAFEKLGINMQIMRHGKFKSAIEPFTRTDMSEENRIQISELINRIWNSIRDSIGNDRHIPSFLVDKMANENMAFQNQERYVLQKLVDGLKYETEVLDELKQKAGATADLKWKTIPIKKYKNAIVENYLKYDANRIALVYAAGAIDDGSSDGVNSKEMIDAIREVRADSTIKAVVLRINSPGGSAYGSEQIWHEIELTRKIKPIVVSMGDVAASGGYYIACNADMVMLQPTTITGSIGIFGMIPDFKGLSNKLGITFDREMTHELSDFPNVLRAMSANETSMMQNYIERGYDTFVTRCADGRSKQKAAIDSLGQGRVWSGGQAIGIGLADKYGNLHDAMEQAAKLSGLNSYMVIEYPKEKDFFSLLMDDLEAKAGSVLIKTQLGEDYGLYQRVKNFGFIYGMQARMPFEIKLN